MESVFEHNPSALPKVSIILLDWSCRESFHILQYLNNQMVPRGKYEYDSDAIFRETFIEEILGQGCINWGDVFYVGCDKR